LSGRTVSTGQRRCLNELLAAGALHAQCVALAWIHEADYFVLFFGLAATIAGAEAIRRSQ
jgi:hypothetical protein